MQCRQYSNTDKNYCSLNVDRLWSLLIDFHTRSKDINKKQWLPEKNTSKNTKQHAFENGPQKFKVN